MGARRPADRVALTARRAGAVAGAVSPRAPMPALRHGLPLLVLTASLVACRAGVDCTQATDPADPPGVGARHPKPWDGAQRALVLPLSWPDAPSTSSVDTLEDAFFGPELSVDAWLRESSVGAVRLSGTVLPWREAPEPWAVQEAKNPGHIIAMARCVFRDILDREAHDSHGNGRIDHLFVVHSGRLPVDRIGPRALFAAGQADRSVVLQSQGIGAVGRRLPIGFYLHEAGHRYLGLEDRYGDHRHGNYGIGTWGLMGLGQWGPHAGIDLADLNRFPTHLRARAKRKLGWGSVRVLTDDAADVLLQPIETSGEVVRVRTTGTHDLFLEVRSPVGFHAASPGHGLLVWREPKVLSGEVTLLQADGRDDLANGDDLGRRPLPPNDQNFADASDPFPGSEGVTAVHDPVTGVRIHQIRHEGAVVRFGVDVPPLSEEDPPVAPDPPPAR